MNHGIEENRLKTRSVDKAVLPDCNISGAEAPTGRNEWPDETGCAGSAGTDSTGRIARRQRERNAAGVLEVVQIERLGRGVNGRLPATQRHGR
jgi:hypothetical protein